MRGGRSTSRVGRGLLQRCPHRPERKAASPEKIAAGVLTPPKTIFSILSTNQLLRGHVPLRPTIPFILWTPFGLLVGVSSVGIWSIHAPPLPNLRAPVSVADASELNFGPREQGETFDWPIRIVNHTAESVHIVNFRASCTCTTIQPEQIKIGSASVGIVTLTVRTPTTTTDSLEIPVEGWTHSGLRVFSATVYGRLVARNSNGKHN